MALIGSFCSDDIAAHLESDGGEWTTEPYPLVDEGNGWFVVARGALSGVGASGSVTFVIMREADGGLKIARTAWVLGSR